MSIYDQAVQVEQANLSTLVAEVKNVKVFADLPLDFLEWFVSNCKEG